jgi:hypothetical protein
LTVITVTVNTVISLTVIPNMKATPVNPFFFEHTADRWSFTDREKILPIIEKLLNERGRRVLFYGRRRMGKTSLIDNAALKASTQIIKVDLSLVVGLTEAATLLLNQIPRPPDAIFGKIAKLVEKKLGSVSVSLWKFAFKADLRQSTSQANIDVALDFIEAVAEAEDIIYTVWLDEFQEIWKLGGEDIAWRIRALSQRHHHINYFFSGSDHRLLKRMTDPKAAFFKQLETIEVGPIDPELMAKWIDARMKQGGIPAKNIGADIVAVAGPCTGDIVRVAKTAFDILAAGHKGEDGDVAARAMNDISLRQLHNEHAAFWRQMTLVQRAVLRALAAGRAPQSAETVSLFGIGSPSNAGAAVEALVEAQFLARNSDGRGVFFDSPFFKQWVAANGAPSDVVPLNP